MVQSITGWYVLDGLPLKSDTISFLSFSFSSQFVIDIKTRLSFQGLVMLFIQIVKSDPFLDVGITASAKMDPSPCSLPNQLDIARPAYREFDLAFRL